MSKVTKEQMKEAIFRRLFLSEKISELEGIISGLGTSLDITDGDGTTDPEKLTALIKGLVESFEHSLELQGRSLQKWEKDMYSSFLYCAMQLKRLKENRSNPSVGTMNNIAHTFEDILGAAADVGVDPCESMLCKYRDFQKMIYCLYRNDKRNIFNAMLNIDDDVEYKGELSKFCSALIDDLITASSDCANYLEFIDLPRELHEELCTEYAQEHGISYEDNKYFLMLANDPDKFYEIYYDWYDEWCFNNGGELEFEYYFYGTVNPVLLAEKYGESWSYLAKGYGLDIEEQSFTEYMREKEILTALGSFDDLDSFSDNEKLSGLSPDELRKYMRRWIANESKEENKRWRHFIADEDELRRHFLTFVQLYYDHDHSGFYKDVEDMVQAYLIEHKLSSFAFGEDYGHIMYLLERASKHIAKEIEWVKTNEDI